MVGGRVAAGGGMGRFRIWRAVGMTNPCDHEGCRADRAGLSVHPRHPRDLRRLGAITKIKMRGYFWACSVRWDGRAPCDGKGLWSWDEGWPRGRLRIWLAMIPRSQQHAARDQPGPGRSRSRLPPPL